MKVILSIIMVDIALGPKEIKRLLKQLVIFYLSSFAFGGCAFALLYFIKPQDVLIKNGVYIGTYPIKIALLGGIVGFIIIQTAFKIVKTKLKPKDMLHKIKIQLFEKQETICALLDTGNLLRDPITKTPVIIVEKAKMYNILPKELLDNIEEIINGKTIDFNDKEDEKYLSKMKIIPFSSIGKTNGMMLGIRANKVTIEMDENEKEIENVIIGISLQKIGQNYSAIFGLDLFEKGERNEFTTNIKK